MERVCFEHAPRLLTHLALHDIGADTFSPGDILDSFVIEPVGGVGAVARPEI